MSESGGLKMPSNDARGEFVGPISDTLSKALRFEEAVNDKGSELHKCLNNPETDPYDLWQLQHTLYVLIQNIDSDTVQSDSMHNLESLTQALLTGSAVLAGMIAAIWTGSLIPVAVAARDPEKGFNYNREAREQEATDRAELRAALVKVHTLVIKNLKARNYTENFLPTIPEPPKRRKSWTDE
jgi:hypothetical protein